MAYDAQQHEVAVKRIEKVLRTANDSIAREMAEIRSLYTTETASGLDPAWTDSGSYTEAELTAVMNVIDAISATWTAQISNINPFLVTN